MASTSDAFYCMAFYNLACFYMQFYLICLVTKGHRHYYPHFMDTEQNYKLSYLFKLLAHGIAGT